MIFAGPEKIVWTFCFGVGGLSTPSAVGDQVAS